MSNPNAGTAAASGLYTDRDRWVLTGQVYLALIAFGIGILQGLAQALDRVLPPDATLWSMFPGLSNYYQGLTAHGVLLAFVFTFAFSNGFMTLVHQNSLQRRPRGLIILLSLVCIVGGGILAAAQIFTGQASVLFTMYPPLKASPWYYLGAVLVVVSTWLTALNALLVYRAWRRDNRGERIPLQAFAVLTTYAMWFIASLGVAIETLALLLPWSMGLLPLIDPQLARTLFWFSGHAIVYFWLLPAYLSWYTMVPKQAGGRLYSDGLARMVFILFLLLSTPTGVHHQFTDPGIRADVKALHYILTMGVFFPSMITAFSVMAALEVGGRARGGKGLFGWIRALPWGDPSVAAQLLAMMGFVLGGISGLINASYTVNLVVHNTAWIPGHFHLTVGTAVALSILGICYWLVPYLSDRVLWGRRVALAQCWLWLIGVLIFSRGQIMGGLEGLPRRLNVSGLAYDQPFWATSHAMTAFGGTVMFISGCLFFVVIGMTLLRGAKGANAPIPVAEAVHGARQSWPVLDDWRVWLSATVLLIVLAYLPVALTYTPNFVSPPNSAVIGGH